MAQRLVRKICEHCKTEKPAVAEDWITIHEDPSKHEGKSIFYGKGCPHCRNSGYSGRTGIFEIMEIKQNIRKLIYENANQEQIREACLADGMVSLRAAGIRKALNGITTLSEVKRATVEDF